MLTIRPTTTDWLAVLHVHGGWNLALRDPVRADTTMSCAVQQIARACARHDWRLELARRGGGGVTARLNVDGREEAYVSTTAFDEVAAGEQHQSVVDALLELADAARDCAVTYWPDLIGRRVVPAAPIVARVGHGAIVARGDHAAWAAPAVASIVTALDCPWCVGDRWWVEFAGGRAVRRPIGWIGRPCSRCADKLQDLETVMQVCHAWVVQ